jgi:hypothetical protein
MSPEFSQHVSDHLVPFARQALNDILVQGFCAYGIKPPRLGKSKFHVPFIISRSLLELSMVVDHGQDRLQCRPKEDAKISKIKLFIDEMPESDGTLNSRVAGVSKTISYLEELEKHDIQSFAIRSSPPVLTKTKTDNAFDSRDVLGGGVDGLMAQDASDNMRTRNMINVDQYKQQADLIKTLNREKIDSSDTFWKKHVDPTKMTYLSESLRSGVEGYVPRFIPLPADADVAAFNFANERKDYVQLQKFCKSQICTGLGVPEAFVDGSQTSGGAASAIAKNMDEIVRVSLTPLRSALGRLMLEVFHGCYGNSNSVQCLFPGPQNIDKMYEWYTAGLLKQEALINALSCQENIRREDFIEDEVVSRPASASKRKHDNEPVEETLVAQRQRKRWMSSGSLSVFT